MTDEVEKSVETEVVTEVATQGLKLSIHYVAYPVLCSSLAMALHSIPAHEGNRLKAYKDIANVYTVCGGIAHVKPGTTETADQCKKLTDTEIGKYAVQVAESAPANIPADVLAADIDFAYNEGIGTFRKSSVLALQKKQEMNESCLAFEKYVCFTVTDHTGEWDKRKDCYTKDHHLQFSQGLKNRRNDERNQCLGVK